MIAISATRSLRTTGLLLAAGILFLMIPAAIFAQADEHANHAHVGWVPEEILNRPVALRQGVGMYHERVTTSSPLAQKFYDQGVAYIHSYVWIEAARSFHQALRSDPKMAMGYLGLSYAYSPMDYGAARAALEQATSLSAAANDRERRRIAIRQAQLDAMAAAGGAESVPKLLAFRRQIDAALAANPDDVELLLIRGHAEEPTPFGDGQGCVPTAIPYYEHALALSPDNFAAHHFLAHCYENQGKFSDALEQARVYAQAASQIPHAQHMYGHELRGVGRTEDALQYFLKADALENGYYQRENIAPSLDWHHAHNLSLLASAYQYEGQLHLAERYFAAERQLTPFTEYAEFNRKDWPELLLNRADFARALAAAKEMAGSRSGLSRAGGHCLAGMALVALRRTPEAGAELGAAEMESSGLNRPDAAAVSPYLDLLKLAILLSQNSPADAPALVERISQYTRRATSADSWSQGLFRVEALSMIARQANQWDIAQQLADLMLAVDPNYGGSHYAKALVAEHRQARAAALQEFEAARRYWNHADADFPPLEVMRRATSSSRAASPRE
jgi:tetratricopeptide (TPR) repeat protein